MSDSTDRAGVLLANRDVLMVLVTGGLMTLAVALTTGGTLLVILGLISWFATLGLIAFGRSRARLLMSLAVGYLLAATAYDLLAVSDTSAVLLGTMVAAMVAIPDAPDREREPRWVSRATGR